MRLAKSAVLAAAVATGGVMAVQPAQAHGTGDAKDVLALLQRIATQYMVLTARSFVDLTYEQLTIEPGTNNMVISGLKVYPTLDWDKEGKCAISVERVVTGDVFSFETLSTGIEVSGVQVPAACFDPDIGGMMGSFGYNEVVVDQASIEISYNMPDSSAEMVIQAAVKDAMDISISAEFGYLWFNLPIDGRGDPYPVVQLNSAEVAIENKGLWEKLEPMVGGQFGGDITQVPMVIQMGLGQMLTEGGERTPSAAESAFVENLAAEVGRFLQEKNRLVITAAPEGGVWLDEDAFDSPQNMISALRPSVSGVPAAYRRIIAPADLQAALAGNVADDAAALRIGGALVTGIGAPRSIEAGAGLLAPLAAKWNGEAALMLAKAYMATGQDAKAYENALIALAGGQSAALGVADTLEARMALADVLAAQSKAFGSWPDPNGMGAAVEGAANAGDVGAIRKAAADASVGRNMPRSYEVAYLLATVAAAGGDRGAANLRDRMDRRFGTDAAWRAVATKAEGEAVGVWTGSVGKAIADRAK